MKRERRPAPGPAADNRRGKPAGRNDRERRRVTGVGAENLRASCARALGDILLRGSMLKKTLDFYQKKFERESDRALMKEVVTGVTRNLPLIDLAINTFVQPGKTVEEPLVLSVLRSGAYQLLFLDKVPAYAAVSESVSAVKQLGHEGAAGFVNTVLRRIAGEKDELLSAGYQRPFPQSLCFKYGMPQWIVERYVSRFGEAAAEEALESLNRPARNSIVFFSAEGRMAASATLSQEGFRLEENRDFELTYWVKEGNPSESAAFRKGLFYICDPSSQVPALLLPLPANGLALDLCAAPGTKTVMISKRLPEGSALVSSDVSPARLRQLEQNRERYGLENVFVAAADAATGLPFRDRFDSVILDAPCSSTGTMRRNPEIRWQVTPERLEKEGERQARMLLSAAGAVKKGGHLLYSVCSTEPEETSAVVDRFLDGAPGFSPCKMPPVNRAVSEALSEDGTTLCMRPGLEGGDSFFVALFRRRK